MRYLIGTEQQVKEASRQECLDRNTDPSAVTQYWYAWRETANAGTFALEVGDDKNPIAVGLDGGVATTGVEPEWPEFTN